MVSLPLVTLLLAGAPASAIAPNTPNIAPGVNVADLPDRCPVNQLSISEDDFGWDMFLKGMRAKNKDADKDLLYMDLILHGDMRMQPLPVVMTFMKESNFFARRDVLYPKFEKRIEAIGDAKERMRAYGNYAMTLVYLGDFKKVISFFAEGPKAKSFLTEPTVTFAIANAYWRLKSYPEASKYARIAFKLDDQLDSRWMLMLSDVGIHGKEWMEKHDDAEYSTKFVSEIFPAKDWSGIPFENVTDALGVDKLGGTGSVTWYDLDGDGWDELIWERKFFPYQIYKNNQGTLTKVDPKKLGTNDCTMIIATPVDFDNDGKPDIFRHCCNYDGAGPSVLLKNEGELTFDDITKGSGVENNTGYGMVVAWADYDLDGWLDLAVGDANATTRLYHNTGHGTFTEVTKAAGTTTPGKVDNLFGTVGVAWGDLNDDGYPDLFIQGWGWKRLFMNNKDGTFKDVTKAAHLNEDPAIKGYTNQIFDYDNDGKLDLYTGQYVVSSGVKWGFAPICTCSNLLKREGYQKREWQHASTIYKNMGDGTFKDMAADTHFIPLGTMGADNGDWDNDGDQDIVMGAGGPYFQQAEPYLFYENLGNGKFALRTPFYDLSLWGKGHGASFGDYDHDGNLDLAINNGGATPGDIWPSMVLHNKGNANHWFEIGFKGNVAGGTNSQAIGARVKVTAGGKTYLQELWTGSRFGAANTSRLHFGMAKNTKIDKVEIRWPNKKLATTVFTNVDVDQAIEVDEATGKYKQLWSFPHGEGLPNAKPAAVTMAVPK